MKSFFKENKLTVLRIVLSICLVVGAIIINSYNSLASFILYMLSYLTSGCLIIFYAIADLFRLKGIGEKLLMLVASVGAIAIGEYFEACVIVILFELGGLIEDLSITSSRSSVDKLASIRPNFARLKDTKENIPVENVKCGQIIEVLVGERIPLDGIVIEGMGSVDTSVITGESMPRDVRAGSEVLAGYLNLGSVLYLEVIRESESSAAQRIIDLSKSALDKKTKNERFIKKFARIYTPIVIGIALLVALIPPLFDGMSFARWIYRACSVLAISCPCALVISVPLAYFCGIGYASKKGILIKNSSVMESLEKINTAAFDKTGTLTKAELHVNKIEAMNGFTKIQLLECVCIAEMKSKHPIAQAVSYEAKRFNIQIEEGTNYEEHVGKGVECDSKHGHIKAGNSLYIDATTGISTGTVFVSVNGKYAGFIGIGDELKANSKIAFERLRKLGVTHKYILSGDKKSKVDAVAKTLLADGAYSNLLPEHKLEAIEDIISSVPNCRFMYCGDGINDLPSLARADVGVAMGAVGSDAAVEKSDVVIMDDDIGKVPMSIKIARRVKRVVLENIVFAIAAKAALLVLSVIGILPLFGAVLGDVGILILTVINSARAGR